MGLGWLGQQGPGSHNPLSFNVTSSLELEDAPSITKSSIISNCLQKRKFKARLPRENIHSQPVENQHRYLDEDSKMMGRAILFLSLFRVSLSIHNLLQLDQDARQAHSLQATSLHVGDCHVFLDMWYSR